MTYEEDTTLRQLSVVHMKLYHVTLKLASGTAYDAVEQDVRERRDERTLRSCISLRPLLSTCSLNAQAVHDLVDGVYMVSTEDCVQLAAFQVRKERRSR